MHSGLWVPMEWMSPLGLPLVEQRCLMDEAVDWRAHRELCGELSGALSVVRVPVWDEFMSGVGMGENPLYETDSCVWGIEVTRKPLISTSIKSE